MTPKEDISVQFKKSNKNKEKRSVISVIRDTIINIFMILAILIFILALYTMYKHQDDPNNAFLLGYKPVYVMTGSMEPTLKVNGIVIIKEASYDEIVKDYKEAIDGYVESENHKNDKRPIIMYEIDNKMITHRVVDVTDEGIRTKGDNNNVQDAYYLQSENIRGEAVAIWNWTADIINSWKTENGHHKIVITAILVICAVLFILGIKMFLIQKKSQEPDNSPEAAAPGLTDASINLTAPEKKPLETPKILTASKPRHAVSAEEAESTQYISALITNK